MMFSPSYHMHKFDLLKHVLLLTFWIRYSSHWKFLYYWKEQFRSLQFGLSLSTSLVWKRWISVFKYHLKQTGHSVSNIHWIFKVLVVTDDLWDRFLAHVDWWDHININRMTLIYVTFKIQTVELWDLLYCLTVLQMYWDVCLSHSKLSKNKHVCMYLFCDNYNAFTSQNCTVNYKNVSPEHSKQYILLRETLCSSYTLGII